MLNFVFSQLLNPKSYSIIPIWNPLFWDLFCYTLELKTKIIHTTYQLHLIPERYYFSMFFLISRYNQKLLNSKISGTRCKHEDKEKRQTKRETKTAKSPPHHKQEKPFKILHHRKNQPTDIFILQIVYKHVRCWQ